jgi:hypothetical protein
MNAKCGRTTDGGNWAAPGIAATALHDADTISMFTLILDAFEQTCRLRATDGEKFLQRAYDF